MGYGDDIMATAYARAEVEKDPEAKVVFGDPENLRQPFWSPVFLNNPHVIQPKEHVKKFICVPEYPGKRRYVDYGRSVWGNPDWADGERQLVEFAWNPDFRAPRGEFFFTEDEKKEARRAAKKLAQDFVVIEPNVAAKRWINNKSWLWENWQRVVAACPDIPFVQFGHGGPWLDGVERITLPFRQAAALLGHARGVVVTEGGLHHAAAALRIPAVVLWGHFTSPAILGYDDHVNLRAVGGIGCGKTEFCAECADSLQAISVSEVVDALRARFAA